MAGYKVVNTRSAQLIRIFWKPDGRKADQEAGEKIRKFMKEKKIYSGPGSLGIFIYEARHEDLRQEFIKRFQLNK